MGVCDRFVSLTSNVSKWTIFYADILLNVRLFPTKLQAWQVDNPGRTVIASLARPLHNDLFLGHDG